MKVETLTKTFYMILEKVMDKNKMNRQKKLLKAPWARNCGQAYSFGFLGEAVQNFEFDILF